MYEGLSKSTCNLELIRRRGDLRNVEDDLVTFPDKRDVAQGQPRQKCLQHTGHLPLNKTTRPLSYKWGEWTIFHVRENVDFFYYTNIMLKVLRTVMHTFRE